MDDWQSPQLDFFTQTMRANLVTILFLAASFVLVDAATGQSRPASPRGEASTQISGKWVVVDYGRPILRGRTSIFGSPSDYGKAANSGAPVWRAGANQSTRFKTEVDLMFGDKHLSAGEYSVFVDLKSEGWTLVLSNHTAKENFRDEGDGLWGAFGYNQEMDALRVPMEMMEMPSSSDQFTIMFVDATDKGGTLAMWWEKTMAKAAFTTM
jgi:hypothetical protein